MAVHGRTWRRLGADTRHLHRLITSWAPTGEAATRQRVVSQQLGELIECLATRAPARSIVIRWRQP